MDATRAGRPHTSPPVVLLRTEPGAAAPVLACEQCGDPVALVLLSDGRWNVVHLDRAQAPRLVVA